MRKINFMIGTMFFVLSLLSLHAPASAAVAGIWDVSGILKEVVRANGKSMAIKTRATDVYTFETDGTFSAEGLTGTWQQIAKKFSVTVDMAAFQAFCAEAEEALEGQYNIQVNITPQSITLSGSESKKNKITGTLNAKISMYYPAYKKTGTMTMQYPFTGRKASVSSLRYGMPLFEEFPELSKPLAERIAEAIAEEFYDNDD